MAPLIAAILIAVGLGLFLRTISLRVRPLLFARGDDRTDEPRERSLKLLEFGFGQKRLPTKPEWLAGFAHVCIFAAFLFAQLGTLNSFGAAFVPDFELPLLNGHTGIGRAYLYAKDVVTLLGTLGVAVFLVFRVLVKKERMTLSREGTFILFMIAGVLWTDVLIDAAEISQLAQQPAYFPLAGPLAFQLLPVLSPTTAHGIVTAGVLVHIALVLVFLNFLPLGKHFHILTSLPTVYFQRLTPQGQLSKIDVETAEKFGTAKLLDLSWKEILDTYSCTECGRCQTYCPTYATGKPLSHKEVNRAIRHQATELAPQLPLPLWTLLAKLERRPVVTGGGHGPDHGQAHGAVEPQGEPHGETAGEPQGETSGNAHGEAHGEPPAGATALVPGLLQLPADQLEKLPVLVGEGAILPDETIWACTTCGWCEQACPVFIEQIPRIVDLRRNLVLMESRFPEEAARVFKSLENQGNPWGMGSNKRAEWCEDLAVPTAAALKEKGEAFEYLFFVGCAGSYDERQKKVSRAIVQILREAKVSFAILGEEETCTGDAARRLGNEYLFQALAQQNVDTFKGYGVQKVLTQCPHCFNSIANEFPQFGGRFEVVHHTQLIAQLVAEKRLQPGKLALDGELTVHDSCYLARHNDVVEAPRQALVPLGIQPREMERSGKETFCCGAGGGRMWLEEKLGQRINQNRVDEAAKTLGGRGTIATSCPFCLTMMKDGIAETGRSEEIVAKDVAELVAAALPRRESAS